MAESATQSRNSMRLLGSGLLMSTDRLKRRRLRSIDPALWVTTCTPAIVGRSWDEFSSAARTTGRTIVGVSGNIPGRTSTESTVASRAAWIVGTSSATVNVVALALEVERIVTRTSDHPMATERIPWLSVRRPGGVKDHESCALRRIPPNGGDRPVPRRVFSPNVGVAFDLRGAVRLG